MTVTTQQIVTMLIGVVAPLVVGLVTRASTSSDAKAILLAAIAALTGIGQGFVDNPPGVVWDWQNAVFYAISAFIVAVGMHYGLYKNTPITKVVQGNFIKDKPADDEVWDEPNAA